MSPLLLALVALLALVLAYVNGFHDASNAVSTTISTRALSERAALGLAALLNLLGALLGLLAVTFTADWALRLLGLTHVAEATAGDADLLGWALVVMTLATLAWEILTWWLGMPSSTWHAFFGAAMGTSMAVGAHEAWPVVIGMLLGATLLGPLLGSVLSFAVMRVVLALGRSERVRIGPIRFAQTVSAGAVATAHGMSDARLPLALVVIACATAGIPAASATVMLLPVALAVAAGTLVGGHRIIRTLGRRLTSLSSAQGMVAESTAAAMLGLAVVGFDMPISTSHTLGASVVGAGAAIGRRHVRWAVAGQMILTWLLTPLATAVMALVAVIILRDLV